MRGSFLVGFTCLASLAIAACSGGGDKKQVNKPDDGVDDAAGGGSGPKTAEDRATRRLKEAKKIVPEGSTCLPMALKPDGAPRLELGAAGADAIVCAIDTDAGRLLGPVGCWKVDLASGSLAYKEPEPLPGRGFPVNLEKNCAWDYCLPKDAKADGKAHIAWDTDGKKVAVLAGDSVHLFDAASKNHESTFSVRGDKGPKGAVTGLHLIGSSVVVEADGEADTNVWVFKTDGTAQGPVVALGAKGDKPVSIRKGSLSILDKARIGVSERGMEFLHTYEVETGKRAKLVRAITKKPPCKPAEADAFWQDGDKVPDKCKSGIQAASGHLIGATAVAGAKNFLVLLRGERLGELGVLDAKTLAEKKAFKLEWCGGEGGADKKADKEALKEATPKGGTRGATKKTSADPDEGGE